ncbi:UDP-N-acetylmuramoyl-tripeptide--D-alanyl-D-alanine ligase [Thermohalobacter berrensis]|uniref:UDP-N-acetylmuramyl peptide synthase n=1 Tax=Thermohalobacter berrensis TaxID=99594 RepID=A0A419SV75_9FIRM|nr:UDP-N-acetylmuramoyl-tripeptide--D-alanyl-D-alanine ligase [Thermohalobacter berrensis]RKD29120.1 UDP-N-acetylmuramyl peptide synthase [Thermohalobacter berrensis]
MNIINSSIFTMISSITLIVWFVALYFRSKFALHMIQLEGYKTKNYINWLKEFRHRVFPGKVAFPIIGIMALFIIHLITINITKSLAIWLGFVVLWIILLLLSVEFKKEKAKKELIFTKRAKRLFISNFIVNIFELAILYIIYYKLFKLTNYSYPIILVGLSLIYLYVPYNMILANILVSPIEKRINNYYYNMAYNKVRGFKDLKVVGITGSFGKTSTKFITTTILKEKFNVLKTPESYNTPMGISKVINNTLNEEHEVFVAEMGARKIGDIKEVAQLSNPHIGILTSVGPAHLDTFKNIENIMKTKYELIEELPPDGIAIFNYDNEYVRRLADKTFKEKILYGMNDTEKLDLYATDIQVSEEGSTFILKDKEGNSVKCKSNLLGKHNISNLLAGAAAGKALGLTLEEIAKGIEKVEPVPHRLQLINPGTGVIVIDDAFNSNPVGARAALEVLSQFREGRKVIVTPGMVELGKEEEKENKEFGRSIAKVCDYAILVGKNRTKPIYEGLIEEGFNTESIFVVNSLDDATKRLQQIVKPKDVVLFENDLPDTYNEE